MEKVITVQVESNMDTTINFKEFEFPLLNGYLDSGWTISQVHQSVTNANFGYVYLTFILYINR